MRERQIPNFERLKILIVSPYSMEPPGGVQSHTEEFEEFLFDQGHDPTIVAPFNPKYQQTLQPSSSQKRLLLGEVSGHEHNGTIAHVPKKVPVNPVGVEKVLNAARPDIVHGHDPYLSLPALQLIVQSRLPLFGRLPSWEFATFHAYNSDTKPMYKIISRLKYGFDPLLDGTIVVSEATNEFAQRFYPKKHEIIPNGINISRFSSEEGRIERFLDGKVNIVYVGRLEGRKGVKYLLAAYAILRRKMGNIRLVVAGDGPQMDELMALRDKNGIMDVEFLGRVSDEDLPKLYKTADICAFFATHGEAQGKVLIEAQAAGAAVVAGNNRGFRTVIKQGENGLLVNPKKIAETAETLKMLIQNEAFRKKLAAKGFESAQIYDWSKVGPRVIDFYKEQILKKAAQLTP